MGVGETIKKATLGPPNLPEILLAARIPAFILLVSTFGGQQKPGHPTPCAPLNWQRCSQMSLGKMRCVSSPTTSLEVRKMAPNGATQSWVPNPQQNST